MSSEPFLIVDDSDINLKRHQRLEKPFEPGTLRTLVADRVR